jgi:hypothetical protein
MWTAIELLAASLLIPAGGGGAILLTDWLVGRPALRRRTIPLDQAFAAGLGLWLAITLLAEVPDRPLILAGGAVGAVMALRGRFSLPHLPHPVFVAGAVVLTALTLVACVGLPLTEWDARSIWFHQGRILFYFGPDWDYLASIGFAHPDYPKLLPAASALVSEAMGQWSDFHAKYASFLLALPVLLASLRLSSPACVAIQLCWAVSLYAIGNGYLDALLALGTLAVAALLAECTICDPEFRSSPSGLSSGLLCAGLVANMKNEGLVATFVVAIAVIAAVLIAARGHMRFLKFPRPDWTILLLAAGPVVLWSAVKHSQGLEGDLLAGGALAAAARVLERLQDGELGPVMKALLVDSGVLLLWVGCSLAWWLPGKERAQRRLLAVVALLTSLLYTSILALVYLSTPFGVGWHIATSAARVTLLPTFLAVLAFCYLLVPLRVKLLKPNSEADA